MPAFLASTLALAKEGPDQYPNGAENFMAGALPPPGHYFINYLGYYSGKYRDHNGDEIPGLEVNATFNALSASALLLGVVAIKRKDRATHQRLTTAALVFSALFLVSYITYHSLHGDTPFPGQGAIRPIYFFILISHIGLSIVALPLVLTSFYFGWTDQVARHRRLAKVTFPLWLYVSVTGVAIVALLKAYA